MRLKYAGRVPDLDRSGNLSVEEGASAKETGSRANPRSYLVKKRLRARAANEKPTNDCKDIATNLKNTSVFTIYFYSCMRSEYSYFV